MHRLKLFAALALILLVALLASAHDTWLLARRAVVQPGSKVTLDLTSGMAFPLLDTSIKQDRVDVAKVRLHAKTFDITDRLNSPKSLMFRPTLPDEGIATIWVDLKPRSLELTPAQVKEYLSEIDATPEVREAWKRSTTGRWRESYVKHTKTFVLVGSPAKDDSWSEPVGMSLEFVPEKDPTSLVAGDKLPVRVLRNGTPLANFAVSIVRSGSAHGKFQNSDAAGRVEFKLPYRGKWMLRGTELRQSSQPDTEWESDFTTLTFVVK
jgi:uncharacterized GH25 family protein